MTAEDLKLLQVESKLDGKPIEVYLIMVEWEGSDGKGSYVQGIYLDAEKAEIDRDKLEKEEPPANMYGYANYTIETDELII